MAEEVQTNKLKIDHEEKHDVKKGFKLRNMKSMKPIASEINGQHMSRLKLLRCIMTNSRLLKTRLQNLIILFRDKKSLSHKFDF